VAVIVTFHPSLAKLRQLLACIAPQVGSVVVVDNGSAENIATVLDPGLPHVHYIEMGRNVGLAAAQNVGIDWALAADAQHIIFFDQDSSPADDMVQVLLQASCALQSKGCVVGAVGPCFVDVQKGIQLNPSKLPALLHGHIPRTTLIASGSLISTAVLEQVGKMAEALFIDYVDLEWCLRAGAQGFEHYQIAGAQMMHSIGDDPIRFLGKNWPSHSPIRHYYMFRNAIWMYQQPSIAMGWKWLDGCKLIRKFVFYSLFAKPRLAHVRMMVRGLCDGLIGKMGPLKVTVE
jgi:rhamnosyltransferase